MFYFDALYFIILAALWTILIFLAGKQWGYSSAEVDYERANKKVD